MELKNIENLAKLLDEYSLTKIDVTDGKEHYVLGTRRRCFPR